MSTARLLKSRQAHLTQLFISVSAEGKVGGLDAVAVKSVDKIDVGVYKVTLKQKSQRDYIVTSLVSTEIGVLPSHVASDDGSFTVVTAEGKKPVDAGFVATLLMHETRYVY